MEVQYCLIGVMIDKFWTKLLQGSKFLELQRITMNKVIEDA